MKMLKSSHNFSDMRGRKIYNCFFEMIKSIVRGIILAFVLTFGNKWGMNSGKELYPIQVLMRWEVVVDGNLFCTELVF